MLLYLLGIALKFLSLYLLHVLCWLRNDQPTKHEHGSADMSNFKIVGHDMTRHIHIYIYMYKLSVGDIVLEKNTIDTILCSKYLTLFFLDIKKIYKLKRLSVLFKLFMYNQKKRTKF